jgi:hypothetical protein
MQYEPDRQEQVSELVGSISTGVLWSNAASPSYASQFFLLALTEPSLQMNVDPWQWSTPPLLPLQG